MLSDKKRHFVGKRGISIHVEHFLSGVVPHGDNVLELDQRSDVDNFESRVNARKHASSRSPLQLPADLGQLSVVDPARGLGCVVPNIRKRNALRRPDAWGPEKTIHLSYDIIWRHMTAYVNIWQHMIFYENLKKKIFFFNFSFFLFQDFSFKLVFSTANISN